MSRIEYATLTKQNVSDFIEMYIEAFNGAPWFDAWTKESATKRLLHQLSSPNCFALAMYSKEQPCGLVVGEIEPYFDGDVLNIKEFCVTTTMHGQGIGSLFYQEIEKQARQLGVQRILLYTLKGSKAMAFYNKQGLSESQNMIIMDKKL